MNMLSWIFKGRSGLNFIEMQIVEVVANMLSTEAAAILRNQVSLINKVQRLDRNREVDFYRMENGKPTFPEYALFPNRMEKFELAKIHITDTATGHQTDATVSLVKGRLFCIEFSHTPRDLPGASGLKIEIKGLGNPMTSDAKSI